MNTKQLIESVESKDPVAISEAFDAAMKEKCSDRVSQLKEQLLTKMVENEDE